MAKELSGKLGDLPENVRMGLEGFLVPAIETCGDTLVSVVLYGSAAEGRLRPSSDVNLILVLRTFDVARIDGLRENLRVAHAAIRLSVMFVLEEEIPAATEAFAVKFTDIFSRHRVLHGKDPFAKLDVPRSAVLQRLNQVLVNLMLRLRERYALVSLREEQLVPIIADVTGPIRAAAASILSLEGRKTEHPKEALEELARGLGNHAETLAAMSRSREELKLEKGVAPKTLLGILDLLHAMHERVRKLR